MGRGRGSMVSNTVTHFGIDVETRCAKLLAARLGCQRNTIDVSLGGIYREDPAYQQVFLTTHWTEEQLDAWLCKTKGIDYQGTWVCDPDNPTVARSI